nr:CRISPR-associated helicase Cas3' [uncultured Sellimonas sp.]
MEYYAKSKETELSEREKNNLREKLENLADDLEGDLDEKEQQVVLRELENLLKQNICNHKTVKEHTDDAVRCAEDFFSKYGKNFSEFEKELVLEACRLHDLGKVNIIFQIGVNQALKSKMPSHLLKVRQVPHGFLSAVSISMEELKENCKILTIDDFSAFITAVYYHHAREDEWEDGDIKKFAEDYYLPCLEWYSGEKRGVFLSNRDKLLFRNNPDSENRIKNHKQWNAYVLIKGLLNKFDYTVSAGYEQAEFLPDLEKKTLKQNIERVFSGMELRPAQKYMKDNSDKNLVVIAPTGSGKTEAALLWLDGEKGFYTLPLQVSSNAIYDRIKDKYSFYDVSLLHSDSMRKYLEEDVGRDTSAYENYENAKRLAYPLTVCTIDQLFKFVYKALGTEIFAATLKYSKIILDEIQSYSPRVIATIIYGLKTVTEMGGKFAIITATFPPVLKHFMERYGLIEGRQFEFQDFSGYADSVRHKIKIQDTEIEEKEILNAGTVKKVLVICNTVRKAQEIYQKLSLEMEQVFLLHSRYLRRDREQLEKMIMDFSDSNHACGIWITTQIVEASLDIDFDILFTEMSTADSLLQRMWSYVKI